MVGGRTAAVVVVLDRIGVLGSCQPNFDAVHTLITAWQLWRRSEYRQTRMSEIR